MNSERFYLPKPLKIMEVRRYMEEFLMRILRKGKAIAFLLTLLLGLFPFSHFSCAQPPGKYFAEMTLFGYEYYREFSFVAEYRIGDLGVITLTSETGTIKIHIEDTEGMPIADVMVYLNSHYMGVTDQTGWLTISDIPFGDHTITVVKEGFVDYQSIFEVRPGETLYLEICMKRPTNWSYILVLVLIFGGGILIVRRIWEEEENITMPM